MVSWKLCSQRETHTQTGMCVCVCVCVFVCVCVVCLNFVDDCKLFSDIFWKVVRRKNGELEIV